MWARVSRGPRTTNFAFRRKSPMNSLTSVRALAFAFLTVGLLLASGLLLALLTLGRERCGRDPLAFTVATLVWATAHATAVALLLGATGALRWELALPLEAAVRECERFDAVTAQTGESAGPEPAGAHQDDVASIREPIEGLKRPALCGLDRLR